MNIYFLVMNTSHFKSQFLDLLYLLYYNICLSNYYLHLGICYFVAPLKFVDSYIK